MAFLFKLNYRGKEFFVTKINITCSGRAQPFYLKYRSKLKPNYEQPQI
jgi:hypothetical protein